MFKKLYVLLLCLVFTVGCQSLKTRSQIPRTSPKTIPQTSQPQQPTEQIITDAIEEHIPEEEVVDQPASPKNVPKLGLILGPGALRSFIHVGVLQELDRAQIPVTAIAGIEASALIAAAYAVKGQGFDLEWQLFKVKEAEFVKQSMLGKADLPGDISQMNKAFEDIFKGGDITSFKVPFVCPSLNLESRQVSFYSKGKAQDILPYCMTHYPLFKPFRKTTATTQNLSQLAKSLRDKGATHVVYISILGGTSAFDAQEDSLASHMWQLERQTEPRAAIPQINDVILVDSSRPLNQYEFRREHLTRGQKAGKLLVQRLIQTGGF